MIKTSKGELVTSLSFKSISNSLAFLFADPVRDEKKNVFTDIKTNITNVYNKNQPR